MSFWFVWQFDFFLIFIHFYTILWNKRKSNLNEWSFNKFWMQTPLLQLISLYHNTFAVRTSVKIFEGHKEVVVSNHIEKRCNGYNAILGIMVRSKLRNLISSIAVEPTKPRLCSRWKYFTFRDNIFPTESWYAKRSTSLLDRDKLMTSVDEKSRYVYVFHCENVLSTSIMNHMRKFTLLITDIQD